MSEMLQLLLTIMIAPTALLSSSPAGTSSAKLRPTRAPEVRFVPTDMISAENVGLLQTVLFWEVGRPTLQHRIRHDPVNLIDDIGVDGRRKLIYFNPYVWEGRSEDVGVGIYVYDMRSSKLVRKIRIPKERDGRGESFRVTNGARTLYSFSRGHAYVADVDPDGGDLVWRLSLVRDNPELVSYEPFYPHAEGPEDARLHEPKSLATYPILASNSLLLWGGQDQYEHYTVSFFDTEAFTFEGPYSLPRLEGDHRWRVFAGAGRSVCAYGGGRGGCFLQRQGDQMVVTKQLGKLALTFNSSNVLDPAHRRDIAKDLGSQDDLEEPVQVYGIPSMQVLARLPGRANGPFVVIPNTDIIATLPKDDRRAIRFFDLKMEKQIGEVRLEPPAFLGNWRTLICDEEGLYVGAFCSYQVQLFAVRPLGGSIQPDQD